MDNFREEFIIKFKNLLEKDNHIFCAWEALSCLLFFQMCKKKYGDIWHYGKYTSEFSPFSLLQLNEVKLARGN